MTGRTRVEGFYVQKVKTDQTGQMHRSLCVVHRSFVDFVMRRPIYAELPLGQLEPDDDQFGFGPAVFEMGTKS